MTLDQESLCRGACLERRGMCGSTRGLYPPEQRRSHFPSSAPDPREEQVDFFFFFNVRYNSYTTKLSEKFL